MEKLQQEVRLLSSIGTSAQQAEIDQVVRQIREKHSKEKAAWQKVVKDLESQVQVLNVRSLSYMIADYTYIILLHVFPGYGEKMEQFIFMVFCRSTLENYLARLGKSTFL